MAETGFEADEDDLRLQVGLDALVESGPFERLSTAPGDHRLFMDCDLASLVENLAFETVDPRTFTEVERERHEALIARQRYRLADPRAHDWHRRGFFLLDGGCRVGSLALSSRYLGSSAVGVSSLYVFPEHRGRGVAARALDHARRVLGSHGARGLGISTCWTWQSVVRFYLAQRFWVSGWSDEIAFVTADWLPEWFVDFRGDEAHFGAGHADRREALITAKRLPERLDWHELPALARERADGAELASYAAGTFAVALAAYGWLPIRNDADRLTCR